MTLTAHNPPRPAVQRRARHAAAGAVIAVAGVLAMAGCGPAYAHGPDGTITGHRHHYAAHYWRYWLTVTTPTGHTATFRVPRADYHHCPDHAAYPACTH